MSTVDLKWAQSLEKAATLSERPSQYAGCEIGSTAGKRIQTQGAHMALIWGLPYEKAMNDPLLRDLYQKLASCGALPERIFSAGEDMARTLKTIFGEAARFSLESKSRLAEFDALILGPSLSREQAAEIDQEAGGAGRPVLALPPSTGRDDYYSRVLEFFPKLKSPPADCLTAFPLVPYRSSEDSRFVALVQEVGAEQSSNRNLRLTAYRVRAGRRGWSRFVSHLEQIQVFKGAVLLSGLPVATGGGRKPRLKMSFGPAVSVGWRSEAEFFDVALTKYLDAAEIQDRLSKVLPEGFEVRSVRRIPLHFPSLEDSANVVEYWMENHDGCGLVDWEGVRRWFEKLDYASEQALVRKEKPDGKVDIINLKEIVQRVEVRAKDGRSGLGLWLRFAPRKNLKPERILEVSTGLSPETFKSSVIIDRLALGLEMPNGEVRYL